MRIGAVDETTLLRRNLTLPERDTVQLDHLRTRLEASSDSEVVRQSLRYLAELIEDCSLGKKFLVVPRSRASYEITLEALRNDPEPTANLVRRNMMIHESSAQRLELLKELGDIDSDSKAIRMSLKLCSTLLSEVDDGSKFYILDSGEKIQVRLAGLTPVRPGNSGRPVQAAVKHGLQPAGA